jgi:hypothetical protein
MRKDAMKMIVAAALIAAQIATVAPVSAAELVGPPSASAPRTGAFAGARFSVALGGKRASPARLGVAIAPLHRSQAGEGEAKLRFGEGVEFGIAGRQPPTLRLAGHRLAPGGVLVDEDGKRLGVSTIGAAGIAAGVILLGFVVLALAVRGDKDS